MDVTATPPENRTIATLDLLSNGRALPAFGLGIANSAEQQAFGVERSERAAWFDEALPLMRQFWDESLDVVHHQGERFQLESVQLLPKPVQQPMEVWLGGAAKSELRRVGRLGDGWLPSFTTPSIAAEGKEVVEQAASEHHRELDSEHFGVLIPYLEGPLPEPVQEFIRKRHPDADPQQVVATSPARAGELIQEFTEVGFSKFVFHPFASPPNWPEFLAELGGVVLPLQN